MNDRDTFYKNSFDAFCKSTNEKLVIGNEIRRLIQEKKIHRLLDIGAGNGDLAKRISGAVSEYVAVEKNHSNVEVLTRAGVQVHESTWPAQLPLVENDVKSHMYDMVLLSHVLSYEKDEWKNLLHNAWWHVRPNGGVMTLVTYRGEETDWTRVMQELGQGEYYTADAHRERFTQIMGFLKGLGRVTHKKIDSHVEVPEYIEEMLDALELVYTNGRQDRLQAWQAVRAEFGRILKENYDANAVHNKVRKILKPRYKFPFPHFFVNVEKDTDVYISYKFRGENGDFLKDMIKMTETALQAQEKTTFCNLHADPYYHRNNFNVDQVMSHCFSELEGSKQHLVVIHGEALSDGILQEIELSQKQGRKLILAKKTGVEASYLSGVRFEDPVIHWTSLEELNVQLQNHPMLSSSKTL